MNQFRNNVIRAGMSALYFTGAHHVLRPIFAGVGAIFMLHHVRPGRSDAFQPNRHLEITPQFLRATLAHVRKSGIDIVGIDEMHRRLAARDFSRRFAIFTFDDGYRDNRDFALPLMREYDAPFTVYVTSDFAEGSGRLPWVALEKLVAATDRIETQLGGSPLQLDATTPDAKQAAFANLFERLRDLPPGDGASRELTALCARYGVDDTVISRDLCMSWQELRDFAVDPLVTIGAHTVTHCNLAAQSEATAQYEIEASRDRIAGHLQRPVVHFAYPFGGRDAAAAREFTMTGNAGFKTAVTTRPGMIFAANADHFTALPRISLNGNYQDERFLEVLTSGAATAMWNGFRRVDAA